MVAPSRSAVHSQWARKPSEELTLLQRLDPIAGRRVGGEEAAAAGALGLLQPRERVDHDILRIAGALEDLRAVLVGLVFLLAAVRARDQLAGYRRDGAAAGEDL